MRLSKPLRIGAVVAAVGLVLAACGGSGDGGAGDSADNHIDVAENPEFDKGTKMAEIADAGEVTIGTKFKQPLFGFKKIDDSMAGFDVEIAEIIAGKLGIEPDDIDWKRAPSKFRELYLEQDKVDFIVATYTIDDERAQRVSFAGPYYKAGQKLMVREDESDITGPESLKKTDAQICTARGSTSYQNIKEYVPKSRITLFESYSQCADALDTGQVDAVTTDNVILLGLISDNEGKFKLTGDAFTDEPYGVGIPKGDTQFCEFIGETLHDAADSGAYENAWQNTAGEFSKETPDLPELNSCA